MAVAQRASRSVASVASIFIPVLLLSAVGYVTWVFVVLICVNYFAEKPNDPHASPRNGIAIVFLVVYFLLLIMMFCCYLRLFQVIISNPGYIELPNILRNRDGRPSQKSGNPPIGAQQQIYKVNDLQGNNDGPILDCLGIVEGRTKPPVGLKEIYQKDAFVCDAHGLPIFCNYCWNWKLDRTHHCSEVNRCVRRMDHFCPWVGGVISETTMKFFMQFLFYALLFCGFLLASTAFAVSDRQRRIDRAEIHWIICLAMAALFTLLSLVMVLNTTQLTLMNLTTVERLWKGDRAYYIALLLSNVAIGKPSSEEAHPCTWNRPEGLRTISYPLQLEEGAGLTEAKRTFAIVSTSIFDNPWDLGLLRNLQEVLGSQWLDWLLPINYSPHCNHNRNFGQFPYGSCLKSLRKAHGLTSIQAPPLSSSEKQN